MNKEKTSKIWYTKYRNHINLRNKKISRKV